MHNYLSPEIDRQQTRFNPAVVHYSQAVMEHVKIIFLAII